jgi:hypothetical protein
MSAAIRPDDVLLEATRAGVSILPGTSPGKLKLTGPAEAVQRLTPLVAQCKTALLEALSEQAANDDRAATPTRTCRDCQHLTPAKTCANPVGAGLRPHFGIVWPEPTRAATCRAFTERQRPAPEPILTPEQRHRLWWGQPATAEELERMVARAERGERLGLSAREADAAADVLHLRDRDRDDRRLCLECGWLRADRAGWRCGALGQQIPRAWVTTQLQRCHMFRESNHD